MLCTLKKIYYLFLRLRNQNKLKKMVDKGLKIGSNVDIIGDFFFDPSHFFLISIGNNCTLAPNVRLITHDASFKKTIGFTRVGRICIENNCFIGDSTLVLPGVTIGEGSVIGAGSVVTHNIPNGSVAAGNPCRIIGKTQDYIVKNRLGVRNRTAPHFTKKHRALTPDQRDEVLAYLKDDIGYIR
jgi:maltose O-acetyltransferase